MSKKRGADAYGKLVRILIVLFVLTVICGAGYMLLDQSIKAQEKENTALAQQENDRLQEAYNQAKAEEQAAASQVELFEQCDVVSLHIPATPETKQSINYALVGKMKKGGILVNTARKEVIDEAGLIQLMAEREDLKFVTDIMPDANEEFAKFEGRYFSTPKKMGAQTAEANINAGIAAAKQINAFFKDGDTKFQVNK